MSRGAAPGIRLVQRSTVYMRKKTRIIRTTSAVASAALALFLVGLLNVASAPPAAAGCYVSSAESTIHNLVNQARQNAGVPPLTYSCSLDGLALAHSVDMYKHNYFSHMGSDGSTAEQRISTGISEVGYYYGTYGFSGW